MSPAQDLEERKVIHCDRKFTISHNNCVEPNFHSESYQSEARASFKKRMKYNPMEAAKQKPKTRPENIKSEYAQENLNINKSQDAFEILRQFEFRNQRSRKSESSFYRSIENSPARQA